MYIIYCILIISWANQEFVHWYFMSESFATARSRTSSKAEMKSPPLSREDDSRGLLFAISIAKNERIGLSLRENLQETIDFTIKNEAFL